MSSLYGWALFVGAAAGALLVTFLPGSIYWRDSAEFVIAGYFLDITHPPGAPSAVMIGNLASLLPAGPIAWRINGAAAVGLIAAMILALVLVTQISRRSFSGMAAALVTAPILLLTPAFLKQGLLAEVYGWNSVFALLVLTLVHQAIAREDLRPLFAAAFLSGVGVGNHPSLAVTGGILLLIGAAACSPRKQALLGCFGFGVFGLAVFAFLPLRSNSALPLNTGAPSKVESLWLHMSAARDRLLRGGGDVLGADQSLLPFEGALSSVASDLASLTTEISLSAALLALLGAATVALRNRTAALLLVAAALSNLGFFSGWQPDPWTVAVVVAAVFAGIAAAEAAERLQLNDRAAPVFMALLTITIALTGTRSAYETAAALRDHRLPADYAATLLSEAPPKAAVLTEVSWFQLAYLRFVERRREDVALLYQPRLLFPRIFEPQPLPGKFIPEKSERLSALAEPDYSLLQTALNSVAAGSTIVVQPSVVVNSFLRPALRLSADGSVLLVKGMPGVIEDGYSASRAADLGRLLTISEMLPPAVAGEIRHHVESLLINDADLLEATTSPASAADLIEAVCGEAARRCSATSQRNLSVYLQRARHASS